jgi:biopolymer transport protein ExbD
MGGGGGHQPAHADDELDLTPMIDMTFMLLAFFVVSSTMEAGSPLQLPAAHNGKIKGVENSVVITVIAGPEHPDVYPTDGKKSVNPISLSDVTAYVKDEVGKGNTTVIIKADGTVASGFVEDVARAAGEAEGVKDFYVGVRDNGF